MHWASWVAIFLAASIPIAVNLLNRKGRGRAQPSSAMTILSLAFGAVATAS
ncbi:hypothetical protein C8N44_10585 [Allosediminivita pacifica]|uniref:Uncharacterized protein n=2 Tax=Allosediminivita pacifica TaxID=1267769 RepID=A0A2T6B2H1_9RHOB|nr:hypothetical protein C8N44_10585 [Allosediminivita pacifica]